MKKLTIFSQLLITNLIFKASFILLSYFTSVQATEHLESEKLDKKSLKVIANRGDPVTQDQLGEIYSHECKMYKAHYLFEQSAQHGYASGQNHWGVVLLRQEKYQEALLWFTKSYKQRFALAQVNIGIIYYNQDNYWQAFKIFKLSAKQGCAQGQYHLAKMYDDGPGQQQGIPKSHHQAVRWYTAAAKAGYPEAQYELGGCYLVGAGVKQSYEQALVWCTAAANQNHIPAQFSLSTLHAEGLGTQQSYEERLKWCLQAAHQKHGEVQKMLGWIDGKPPPNQTELDQLQTFSVAVAKIKVNKQNKFDDYYEFEQRIYGQDARSRVTDNLNSYPNYIYQDRRAQQELDRLIGQSSSYSIVSSLGSYCIVS